MSRSKVIAVAMVAMALGTISAAAQDGASDEPAVRGVEPGRAPPAIDWRLVNPFRFFGDPADTELHRKTFQSLNADERRHPVLSAEHALSQRHEDGWAADMAA